MASIQLNLNSTKGFDLGNGSGAPVLQKVANLLNSAISGAGGVSDWSLFTSNPIGQDNKLTSANSTVILTSASGTIGVKFSFLAAVEVAASGGDINTANLLKTAINADTQMKRYSTSRNYLATVTLADPQPGIEIDVFGITFRGVASQDRDFTDPFEFTVGVGDPDDASSLASVLGTAPGLAGKVVVNADSDTGNVCIALREDRLRRSSEVLSVRGTGATVSQFANRARVMVFSLVPGAIGNCIPFVVSGTGARINSTGFNYLGYGTGEFGAGAIDEQRVINVTSDSVR